MQIDPKELGRLVERAKALLGGRYDQLEARRVKGANDPHRLVVLIARANQMIDMLEHDGGFVLTGENAVTLSELPAVVPLLEEAAVTPGFEDADMAKTKDYMHSAVMVSARAFLLGVGGADAVDFVATAGSPTPDMNVTLGDAELSAEVYAPQALWHPSDPTLSVETAKRVVKKTFDRKKSQLTGNSILLVGGFGCDADSIDRLKSATADRLAAGNRRPHMAAVAFYVISSWTQFGGSRDALVVEGLSAGCRTGLVVNPGYGGQIRLQPLDDLAPGSGSARLVPDLSTPGMYVRADI